VHPGRIPDDKLPPLGRRIREAIAHSGRTQSASERILVDEYGVLRGKGYLSRIIQGKREPDLPTAVAMARLWGVRLWWLATGDGPMVPADSTGAPQTSVRTRPEDARLLGQAAAAGLLNPPGEAAAERVRDVRQNRPRRR